MPTRVRGVCNDLIRFTGTLEKEIFVSNGEQQVDFKLCSISTTVLFLYVCGHDDDWRLSSKLTDSELERIGFTVERLPEDWTWENFVDDPDGRGSDILVIPDEFTTLVWRTLDRDGTEVRQFHRVPPKD